MLIRFTFWKLDRVSKLKDLSERADPELAEETAETPVEENQFVFH